ncbi:MAG TPA: hypothetical protein VN951_15430 [Pyrinomonadaceae bacterium]|nr:hypothetical protein [Pyrinomonadaceae bacterium]
MNLIGLKSLTSQRKIQSERGAALITVLMMSALLLTAGGALILTTSLSGINTVDAAAEMQAYYGAEAGIQATLNVMRGNVLPNPLFVANPPGTVAPENRIDFGKALTLSTSNLAGDPTTGGFPKRLSRWLTYDYTPSGGSYADRVGISNSYNPFGGIAYSVTVSNADTTPLANQIPTRVVVDSIGYGPRGARKKLSMLLSANVLDIDVPAALVIRGHDNAATPAIVDFGSSNAKTYSGVDNAGNVAAKPTLAVNWHDVSTVQTAYASKPGSIASPQFKVLDLPNDPAPAGTIKVPTPWFLQTADNARTFLAQSEAMANSCAAPAPPGSPCPKRGVVLSSLNGSAGSLTVPQFTIVKGDCTLVSGSGLLIVTGTLYFTGPGPTFNGVILVLGAGRLLKSGGGNRDVYGSIMVARFGATGDFLEPTFDYNGGGGSSNLQYDSTADLNSIVMAGTKVLGIVER